MTHFNQGFKNRLSEEVKNQTSSKYDHQVEEDLRTWIEEVTGLSIGTDTQCSLKNGIILCELINKLEPGSVKIVNISLLNWPQVENISNFLKAIQAYGMRPCDIFEINDLFENKNMTRVWSTLVALADLAKIKGFPKTTDNIKRAEKQSMCFDGSLTDEQSLMDKQIGTNTFAGQVGKIADGTREHLSDPRMQRGKFFDKTTVGLHMDSNKGTSLAGMFAQGAGRDIYDQKIALGPMNNSMISLQMGTSKIASQKGMSVYGLGQQIHDPKYFALSTEPEIQSGSQGTGTYGSEIRDSDYQAKFPDKYNGENQDG